MLARSARLHEEMRKGVDERCGYVGQISICVDLCLGKIEARIEDQIGKRRCEIKRTVGIVLGLHLGRALQVHRFSFSIELEGGLCVCQGDCFGLVRACQSKKRNSC